MLVFLHKPVINKYILIPRGKRFCLFAWQWCRASTATKSFTVAWGTPGQAIRVTVLQGEEELEACGRRHKSTLGGKVTSACGVWKTRLCMRTEHTNIWNRSGSFKRAVCTCLHLACAPAQVSGHWKRRTQETRVVFTHGRAHSQVCT